MSPRGLLTRWAISQPVTSSAKNWVSRRSTQFFASLFFQWIRKISFIGIFLAGNEIDLNSVAADSPNSTIEIGCQALQRLAELTSNHLRSAPSYRQRPLHDRQLPGSMPRGLHRAVRSGGLRPAKPWRPDMVHSTSGPKSVHVNAYTRTRFGRREHVCAHWRSWPNQLSFGF